MEPAPFLADVLSYTNPYPYGMPQPGRSLTHGRYRYGFNGVEQDGEIIGDGNRFSTLFRQYDPRLGRWWSNDPITHSWESPYAAMGGNPIHCRNALGLEPGIQKIMSLHL